MALNLNNLMRLQSVDRKEILYLGAYNGIMSLSVFDAEDQSPKGPMGKILLSIATITVIKEMIEKHITDKNNSSDSIQFYGYDPDIKQSVQNGNITIGRDENGVLYFELTTDTIKTPIRFLLKTFQFGINQNTTTDVINSEYVGKGMIKIMDNAMIALMLSRDADSIKNAAKRRQEAFNGKSSSQGTKTDDDIPF